MIKSTLPCVARLRVKVPISSMLFRSSPLVGSSNTSSSLPQISLTTTARRCICPPERDKGCRSLYASRSTFSNARSISSLFGAFMPSAHSAATLSVKSWYPTSCMTMYAFFRLNRRLIGFPAHKTVPEPFFCNPQSILARVDFPAPLTPAMAMISPRLA